MADFSPLVPAEVATVPVAQIREEMAAQGYPNLSAKDKGFFIDLSIKGFKYGLSPKQEAWFRHLYARSLGLIDGPTPKPQEDVGSFAGVYKLFAAARQHLKHPAITLALPDGAPVVLKMAGAAAKVPNTVNVTDDKPYPGNKWYGRVDQEGAFSVNPKFSEGEVKPVVRLLKRMSEDPAGTAKAYGKLTGRCCFCNKALSDEHSTAAGFGPVCADHYGLKAEWKAATAVLDQGAA